MNRWLSIAFLLVTACVSSTPPQPLSSDVLRGTASWYGQEFAGRTTANGEIFDPLQLTAAHRTLPFGTVLDVKNSATDRVVRVRINDRGPYIASRVLDLSYAAAKQIGLIEPGKGEVEMTVVRVGKGEREPPAAYVVTVPEITAVPLPPDPPPIPVVVDVVPVVDETRVDTRRQVSADGKRIEEVPVDGLKPVPHVAPAPAPAPAPRNVARASGRTVPGFVVQVGAFAHEANAKLLQEQLVKLGEKATIDHVQLYRVRIGPFVTRDEAIRARARLETAGLSAIVVKQ